MSAALEHFYFDTSEFKLDPKPAVPAEEIGIGEMARRFETTLRTLRFYETRGLLKPRREGQQRFYDEAEQRRFKLIDEGRKLGFTLTEIAGMLGQSRRANHLKLTLEDILSQIKHLEAQRHGIDEAIASLRRRYYIMSEPDAET